MAGIFAPTLESGETRIRPIAPVVDRSGEALTGIARTISGLSSDRSRGSDKGPSQSERDSVRMQPFVRQLQRLEKMRSSLGPRYRDKVKSVYQEFVGHFPHLGDKAAEEIKRFSGGVDIELPTDPIVIMQKNLIGRAMKEPGMFTLVYDEKGEVDQGATWTNFQKRLAEKDALDLDMARLNHKKTVLGVKKVEREEATEEAKNKVFEHITGTVVDRVKQITSEVSTGKISLSDPKSIAEGLDNINKIIKDTETTILERAGPFATDITEAERKSILSPLLAMKDMLTEAQKRPEEIAKALAGVGQARLNALFLKVFKMVPEGESRALFMGRLFNDILSKPEIIEKMSDREFLETYLEVDLTTPGFKAIGSEPTKSSTDMAVASTEKPGAATKAGSEIVTTLTAEDIFKGKYLKIFNKVRTPKSVADANFLITTFKGRHPYDLRTNNETADAGLNDFIRGLVGSLGKSADGNLDLFVGALVNNIYSDNTVKNLKAIREHKNLRGKVDNLVFFSHRNMWDQARAVVEDLRKEKDFSLWEWRVKEDGSVDFYVDLSNPMLKGSNLEKIKDNKKFLNQFMDGKVPTELSISDLDKWNRYIRLQDNTLTVSSTSTHTMMKHLQILNKVKKSMDVKFPEISKDPAVVEYWKKNFRPRPDDLSRLPPMEYISTEEGKFKTWLREAEAGKYRILFKDLGAYKDIQVNTDGTFQVLE